MPHRPDGSPRHASTPLQCLKLAVCGVALGLLQIAASLGLEGPEIAAVRLSLAFGVLGIAYTLWRSLPSLWTALAGGFLTGLGYFGTSVYWLGASANPNPDTFIIGEIILGAGALLLFVPWWSIWFGLAYLTSRLSLTPRLDPVSFVLSFSIANVMLADLVMGIPLAPLSLIAIDTLLAPMLGLVGQFGFDSLVVAAGAAVGVLLASGRRQPAIAIVALCATALGALSSVPGQRTPDAETAAWGKVYLAQPSLPHVALMEPANVLTIVHGEVLRQVREGVDAGAELIVLPEGALLVDVTSSEDTLTAEISALLPEGVHVLAGFGRVFVDQTDQVFTVQPYNSVALIDRNGVQQVHDKAHLVPFGETMPDIFFRMGFNVVAGPAGGLGSGDRLSVLDNVGAFPGFALVICYEAILSGAVSRESDGARWLLNVSAETLFRGTIGPRLLHDHIRLRAIETGLPILRSTAHAFSGGIDANGVSFGILAPEVRDGVTVAIPEPQPTYFRAVGYRDYYVALSGFTILMLGAGMLGARRRYRHAATPISASRRA